MAKQKKFERKVSRPTLAASLEAARQGKLPTVTVAEIEPVIVDKSAQSVATAEAHEVKKEISKILLTMGALIALLIALTFLEQRQSLLTQAVNQLFDLFK